MGVDIEKSVMFSPQVHCASDLTLPVPMMLPGVPQKKRGNLRATVQGADWSPGMDGNDYPVLLRRRADMQQCAGCKGDVSTPSVTTGVTPCRKGDWSPSVFSPTFLREGLSPMGLSSPDASSRGAPDPCTCTLM